MRRAVDDGLEADAVVVDPERVREAEDLEAARVREDGAVPVHESMEPAGLLDDVGARAQEEMVGVREDDLSAQLAQLRRENALHRRTRAHRHEHRCLNGAVSRA